MKIQASGALEKISLPQASIALGVLLLGVSLISSVLFPPKTSFYPELYVLLVASVAFLCCAKRSRTLSVLPTIGNFRGLAIIGLVGVLPAVLMVIFNLGQASWLVCIFLAYWIIRPKRFVYVIASAVVSLSFVLFSDQWSPEALRYVLGAGGTVFLFDGLDQAIYEEQKRSFS